MPVAATLPLEIVEENCERPYCVDYHGRANQARTLRQRWSDYYDVAVTHAARDGFKIGAMFIDCQGTFCYDNGELYVAGADGRAAVKDSHRITQWILRNLPYITRINCTMDTHTAYQVFHESFLICGNDHHDDILDHDFREGDHPLPMTFILTERVLDGTWVIDPEVAWAITGHGASYSSIQAMFIHYCRELQNQGKYTLTIWPYHAMIGGVNHALVSAIEEVVFFHGIARGSQPKFEIKGGNPLTENYSVLRPEVLTKPDGSALAQKNTSFIQALLEYDALFIAGQAKSHCVAWTIDDLLNEIKDRDPKLAQKVWLLEDCTSPVVVPAKDFTPEADAAFDRFKNEGMHVVNSTTPLPDFLPVGK